MNKSYTSDNEVINISEEIASYVDSFDLNFVSTDVQSKAKTSVLDTLSVAVGGSKSHEGLIVKEVISGYKGIPESSVINHDCKLPAPNAALINATMAHTLELDDTDRKTFYHPGVSTILPALALAESIRSSGKEFLESIIVGYEVSIRIAEAINPSHRNKGFHTTGTVGTYGAGIACAKLLKLDVNEIMHTLGICGTQAAGLFEFVQNSSMVKRIHPGKSAWNGIVAAQLAQKGFTGPSTILEGKYGFLNATSDTYDLSKLTQDLGKSHRIMRVGIKRHAACRFSHTAIDAAIELNLENNININNIYEIKIYVSKQCVSQTGNYNISSLLSAQFSTPYAVALALVKGNANIDTYKSGLTNEKVRLLMSKITLVESNTVNDNSRESTVHILMNDETILKKKLMLPKGEPETPFTKSELEQKSIELYKGNLQSVKAGNLINYVNVLENENNLQNIITNIS